MGENCRNCGAELFVGQRFCRSCGASTDPLSEEQVPTRMMPPQPEDWGARSAASTAPASRPDTSPVYAPPIGYQPSVPPMHPQIVPPYTPPQSRSRLGWVLAFLGIGLFAVMVVGVMMIARFGRNRANDFGGGRQQQQQQAGETPFNESSADRVENLTNDSTLIKTFALIDDAKVSLKNINGNITVTAWDQPRAEVKVIKRGSDRSAPVFFNNASGNLSIRSAETRNNQDVRYEVKLPRAVGRIELRSENGSIRLAGVTGEILVRAVNGTIELMDVTGVSKVETTNGSIKASLDEASDHGMEFINTNGNIDVTIKSDFDADLDASATHGSVSIDDKFGIPVEKQLVGQRARGQIGSGGRPLKLRTINGSVKLAKQ